MNPVFSRIVKYAKYASIFIACLFVGSFYFRYIFSPNFAKAESFVFNPSFCLGGWEKPQNASGEASIPEGSAKNAFDKNNSAYLDSGVASQIFCGYFNIEDKSRPASSVTISFNWLLDFKELPSQNPIELSVPQSNQASNSANSEIPEAVETKNEINTNSEAAPNIETTVEPVAPVAEPTPVIENSAQSLENIIRKLADKFAQKVYADQSGSDFLEISYSIDGIRWNSLGKVNKSNWKDFKVQIPLTSWDDLKKIQIMVNTLPSVEEKPPIYLESMNLVVDYDRDIGEVAKDGLENAGSVIGSVMDVIQNKIVTIVTDMSVKEEVKVEEKVPVIIKEKKLEFAFTGKTIPSERVLPWYSEEFKKIVAKKDKSFFDPEIDISKDQKSFLIKGECNNKYFVVLLFKNDTDYMNKPGTFGWNNAEECSGGKFSYDLAKMPVDTPPGNYYLMIGEEDESNPWIPASGLIPVSVESVVEERVLGE